MPSNHNPAIEVQHMVMTYRGAETPAVNGLSFSVQRGEFFGLLGPNGAGKSTTISILCGLLRYSSGSVMINGLDRAQHSDQLKRIIGIVPQDIALYEVLTAKENLEFFGVLYGIPDAELQRRIQELLQLFGLSEKADKKVRTFSGGMKRRLNIISGILHRPEIVFLDEPTVGVDVHSRTVINELLKKLNQEGTTILYTSHQLEEAQNLCDRVAIIDSGKLVEEGNTADLLARHGSLESVFMGLTGNGLRDT